jgi:hypothetical protein
MSDLGPTRPQTAMTDGTGRTRPAPPAQLAGRAAVITAVRRMTILGVAAALFSCLFVLSFGYAQHAPRPHDVRIDVVGSEAVAQQIRASLGHALAGGFDVRGVSSEAAARSHLEHMTTNGAVLPAPGGGLRVLTASAAGRPLQQAVIEALSNVARAHGEQLQLTDVVPLPDGDRAGLATFALELGLLVPAVIGAIGFYLMGRRARIWFRVVGAVVYAVLAAVLAGLMLDAVLGALTGSPWALFGDAVLIAGAFVLSVAALHSLMGLPGTALAAGALFVFGNAVNGIAVPTPMLPDVYREIAPWLPNNAAVYLVRSDLYFDGHGQGGPLLTLGIWLGVAALVLVVADLFHLRLRRAASGAAQAAYATPLLAHLRGRNRAATPVAPVDDADEPAVATHAADEPAVATHAADEPAVATYAADDQPAAPRRPVRIEIGETDTTPVVVVTVGICGLQQSDQQLPQR